MKFSIGNNALVRHCCRRRRHILLERLAAADDGGLALRRARRQHGPASEWDVRALRDGVHELYGRWPWDERLRPALDEHCGSVVVADTRERNVAARAIVRARCLRLAQLHVLPRARRAAPSSGRAVGDVAQRTGGVWQRVQRVQRVQVQVLPCRRCAGARRAVRIR